MSRGVLSFAVGGREIVLQRKGLDVSFEVKRLNDLKGCSDMQCMRSIGEELIKRRVRNSEEEKGIVSKYLPMLPTCTVGGDPLKTFTKEYYGICTDNVHKSGLQSMYTEPLIYCAQL